MDSCNEIEAGKFKLELFWQIYNEVIDHLKIVGCQGVVQQQLGGSSTILSQVGPTKV